MPITLDELATLMKDVNDRIQALPKVPDDAALKALVDQAVAAALADDTSEFVRKMRFGSSPPVLVGSKYARWGLSPADVEFLYDMQLSLRGQRRTADSSLYTGPSEELEKAFKQISDAHYLSMEEVKAIDQRALDGVFPRIPKAWLHGRDRILQGQGRWQETRAYQEAMKAMDSAESGYGSQLIGAEYVGELWEAARMQDMIAPLIESIEMRDPTVYVPVEVDFPEMLFVSESTANNSSNYSTSKTGSQRVQLDAKKFVIHQMWSGELEEDSIIPWIPFLRRQAAKSLSYYTDSLILNGDTTNAGTGNINLDDADPADTKHYLAWDGLRHVGLVDNTNNSKNLAAALAARDLLDALERMHDTSRMVHWGFPKLMADAVYLLDSATYISTMDFDEVITVDKMGPRATILAGQLASIWGHPIIVSEAMSKTEADGKVSTTGTNNTLGQVVTFNRNAFKWGWRRRVKLETERLAGSDQTRLVYSLRAGFGRFTPTGAASGIEAADVIRNITV